MAADKRVETEEPDECLVEEPLSGCLVVPELRLPSEGSADRRLPLLGMALRVKRVYGIDVSVYAMAVYAAPEDLPTPWPQLAAPRSGRVARAAASSSTCFNEIPAEEIPAGDAQRPVGQELVEALYGSDCDKVFVLTFLRGVSGKQLSTGLTEGLSGIAKVPRQDIDLLAPHLALSIPKGAHARFTVRPTKGEFSILFSGLGPDVNADEFTLQSQELCRGIHEIYFGPQQVVRGFPSTMEGRHEVLHRQMLQSRGISEEYATESALQSSSKSSETSRRPDTATPRTAVQGSTIQASAEQPRAGSDLDAMFLFAQTALKVPNDGGKVGNTDKLLLYAYFKQATVGDASGARPGMLDQVKRLKWDSWAKLKGTRSDTAKHEYCCLVDRYVPAWREEFVDKASPGAGGEDSGSDEPEVHAERSRSSSNDRSVTPSLIIEDMEKPWVSNEVVPCLDRSALQSQHLTTALYKHHVSILRGILAPKWSRRYYELRAGHLEYRKFQNGSIRGSFSLVGHHVVAEAPKASSQSSGDHFVFQVVSGSKIAARLSCRDKDTAVMWVSAIASACSYFREMKHHDEDGVSPAVPLRETHSQAKHCDSVSGSSVVPAQISVPPSATLSVAPRPALFPSCQQVFSQLVERLPVWLQRSSRPLLLSALAVFVARRLLQRRFRGTLLGTRP